MAIPKKSIDSEHVHKGETVYDLKDFPGSTSVQSYPRD